MTNIKSNLKKLILLFQGHRSVKSSFSLSYISAEQTIKFAKKEDLSVCDYLEKTWNQKGATKRVIDTFKAYGFLVDNINILEIGTGSGRYLEKILEEVKPRRYESYEPAEDWSKYIQESYPVISQDSDGSSLKQTPDKTIDFLHAHGVFVYLPFLLSWRYFKEMWRVTKDDGWIAFDIYSEDCMTAELVEKWLESDHTYPCFLSKDYVKAMFSSHGFRLIDTFRNSHGAGESEYLIFKRI